MDNSVHALIAAQVAQDRIAEATSARRGREVTLTLEREPKLHHVRRWLSRREPAGPALPAAPHITSLPLS